MVFHYIDLKIQVDVSFLLREISFISELTNIFLSNIDLKLIRQDQVLSRTNDYKPTPATLKRQLRSAVKYLVPVFLSPLRKKLTNCHIGQIYLSRRARIKRF